MNNFKPKVLDLKSMQEVSGGGIDVTIKDLVVHTTKATKELVKETDTQIEVSGTVTIES